MIVNGDKITKEDFQYALARAEESSRHNLGGDIDDVQREKIKNDTIDDIIDRQLLIQEARRRGITAKVFAPEEEIDELVYQYQQGSSETQELRKKAEEVIVSAKTRDVLPSKVIASLKEDVSISDREVLDEYLNRAEKMRVRYLKVDPVKIANNMAITEDDIQSYYRTHGQFFRKPGQRTYAVLHFKPEDYIGMVSVSPQMIQDHYNEHMDDHIADRSAKIDYVLFRTKDYVSRVYDLGINSRQYYEQNIDKYMEPAGAKVSFIFVKRTSDNAKILELEN